MAIKCLFSSAGRIFQPERVTVTDNNFENQLLCCISVDDHVKGTQKVLVEDLPTIIAEKIYIHINLHAMNVF